MTHPTDRDRALEPDGEARVLTLFADYHQLYVMDAASEGPEPERWTTDNLLQKAVCGGDHLCVFTARACTVPLRVEILPEAPGLELEGWDHVTDGAMRLTSGAVEILGCTDYRPDAARMAIAPGTYRLRVSMAGLDSLSEDGLEGEDRYRVQLWPGPWRETVVRIMHEPDAAP